MKVFRVVILKTDKALAFVEIVLIAGLVTILTGVTFAGVVTRYVLNDPLIWSEEAARYLFVWVSMMGAARGLHEGAHFGLDALLQHMPPGLRKGCGFITTFVVAAFLVVLLITGITQTKLAGMQYADDSPMTMDLAYLAIPVGAALMLVHLLAHVMKQGWAGQLGMREVEI